MDTRPSAGSSGSSPRSRSTSRHRRRSRERRHSRSHRRRRHHRSRSTSSSNGSRSSSHRRHHRVKASRRDAVLNAETYILEDETYPPQHDGGVLTVVPYIDWVCAVCSNLNSSERERCYRCDVSFNESMTTRPSCVVGVSGCTKEAEVRAFIEEAFAKHGEKAAIVGCESHPSARSSYFRFGSVPEATRALIFCRCQVRLERHDGQSSSTFPLLFAAEHLCRVAGPPPTAVGLASASVPTLPSSNLPPELQWGTWQAPLSFPSEAEEKTYLALLSTHWDSLSDVQKAFYDKSVQRALLAKQSALPATPAPTPAAAAAGAVDAVEALKRRLANRKKATPAAGPTVEPTDAPATPAVAPTSGDTSALASGASEGGDAMARLKQRLAEKRAAQQRSAAPATTATPSETTTTPEEAPEVASRFYFGFPIPPKIAPDQANPTMADLASALGLEIAQFPLSVADRVLPPFPL